MKTYENIPIIDRVLAFAKPDEHERVKNFFVNYCNKVKKRQNEDVLLDYSNFTSEMLQKAAMMLYLEYSISLAEEKALRERKRWQMHRDDFMLDIEEHLSCKTIYDDHFYFDPSDCNIKSRKKELENISSILKTVEEYTNLVREALDNPLSAGRMAHDICLPDWLQAFSAAITEFGFRSGLRSEVERAIEDPAHARMWEAISREDGMEDWTAKMFHILGMRSII